MLGAGLRELRLVEMASLFGEMEVTAAKLRDTNLALISRVHKVRLATKG